MLFSAAPSALRTAPFPRPPQPISPIFTSKSLARGTHGIDEGCATAAAPPASASDEVRRNCRRETARLLLSALSYIVDTPEGFVVG